jgi:hypothetical protein
MVKLHARFAWLAALSEKPPGTAGHARAWQGIVLRDFRADSRYF